MTQGMRPPGPKGSFLLGHLRPFRADPVGFLTRNAREYGDVVWFKAGRQNVYLLSNPEHVREVLVVQQRNFHKGDGRQRPKLLLGEGLLTSQGETHLRSRRLIQPAFHRKRIHEYGATISGFSARHAEKWRRGDVRDISQEMLELTYNVICKVLFDVDVIEETSAIDTALRDMLALEKEFLKRRLMPFVKIMDRLPLPSNRRFLSALARLDAALYTLIRERAIRPEDRGDILSMLIEYLAAAEQPDGDQDSFSEKQIRDEAVTLFIGGHETLASALTWTWHLLGQNPEAEAALHAELDRVLDGRLPSAEDLPQLSYTHMVFCEALRLYPPVWITPRWSIKESNIGGYQIPAKSLVLISPFVTHHDPRFFPDEMRFDPLRWTADARAERPKHSFFPFGAGPRQCIGEPLAWMEGELILATLAQQWRLRPLANYPVEVQPLITLRARNGLPMTLEQRTLMHTPSTGASVAV